MYKNGISLVLRGVRSANYAAGRNALATDSSKKSGHENRSPEKGTFNLQRNLPEPQPVRFEDKLHPELKPKKPTAAVEGAVDECYLVSGVPEEHVFNRRARIYVAARAATQSGLNNTKLWKLEFDNRERWENQLMGWCSSGDPISNVSMSLEFATKEDAIRFCIRQGWEYEIDDQRVPEIKPKAYGSNYAWNKKTRVTTK